MPCLAFLLFFTFNNTYVKLSFFIFCCCFLTCTLLCFRVFNKVKSRSAHMKSHRPLDAEPKRPKLEKPYEKVERCDDRSQATAQ